MRFRLLPVLAVLLIGCGPATDPAELIKPAVQTDPVKGDPDDPAIWVHSERPEASLIIGTTKEAAPGGALVVFDLQGKIRQTVAGIDRPNNVDIEYGLPFQGKAVDIAVATARNANSALLYRIEGDAAQIVDISAGGIPVFEGEAPDRRRPMGIALYRRPRDGAVFAIFSRKSGPSQGYLWQYRVEDGGNGRVKLTKVREFGTFSGKGEIEAVVVDDELGWVYYSDEGAGIHKWHADPDHPQANQEAGLLATGGFTGDREGLAIYQGGPVSSGLLIATDQIPGSSRYRLYLREGEQSLWKTLASTADSTDGIDANSQAMGPRFPKGLLVVMNDRGHNFLYFDWRDVEKLARP